MKFSCHLILFIFINISFLVNANAYEVIQVYTQDELISLIDKNQHLQRVKADDCQLLEDIEAHALKVKEPSFVFLWGDMLSWGVCVKADPVLGMYYIKQAAKQGLSAAMDQLGRYYEKGIIVQKDKKKAVIYYREAALQGYLKSQFNYINFLLTGAGSPLDYEDAYRVLYHSSIKADIVTDKYTHKKAELLLKKLALKMPQNAIDRAQSAALY